MPQRSPEHLAELFRALADPTRLRLLGLLNAHGPRIGPSNCRAGHCVCVNALAHRLGITQSAVSQHLRILRHAGLVRGERAGAFVHYSLNRAALSDYQAAVLEILGPPRA
ncbi:ArsR/SmtB family transcription factor [Myxococcota bacterium]